MGRKKKDRIVADADSIDFVKRELKQYGDLKEECQKFEKERSILLQNIGFNPELYKADAFPVEEMLQHKECAVFDKKAYLLFLEKREVLYLLEHGFWLLDDECRNIMHDLYCNCLEWEDIIKGRNISRMTIARKRKQSINEMALWVDAYFKWKVEIEYGL